MSTFNGLHFDGTSIYIRIPGLNYERIARDTVDVTLDVTMEGVEDIYGTSAKSRGSNQGRLKVNGPSMTFRPEGWDDIVQSPRIKAAGITRYIFDYTVQLKSIGMPVINIECKGCRFLGWNPQGLGNKSNEITIKCPMKITEALWNGVPMVVEN